MSLAGSTLRFLRCSLREPIAQSRYRSIVARRKRVARVTEAHQLSERPPNYSNHFYSGEYFGATRPLQYDEVASRPGFGVVNNFPENSRLGFDNVAPDKKLYDDTNEPDELYPEVKLCIMAHDQEMLRSYKIFFEMVCRELGLRHYSMVPNPPYLCERLTLLRAAFAKKKCRVQYEARTYRRFLYLYEVTGSTLDTVLEYLQRQLPEGMAMRVMKTQIVQPPEHLLKPPEEKWSSIEDLVNRLNDEPRVTNETPAAEDKGPSDGEK